MLPTHPIGPTAPSRVSPTVTMDPGEEHFLGPLGEVLKGGTNPMEDPLLRHLPDQAGFKILDTYVLYSTLGRGSMGAVYRARDLGMEIDVAVKCLIPGTNARARAAHARFRREARLGAALDHPNVVQVLRDGQFDGVDYLVMEYVHGETLRHRVTRDGAFDLGQALKIIRRASKGLAAAHNAGLVHRDVKPGNVMLGVTGEVKVCDLGLAKSVNSALELTRTRAVLGSPRYMAPEQWRDSGSAGPAADIYGLGATLYFLIAGKDANQGTSLDEIRRATRDDSFPDLRRVLPEVPPEISRLLARCVARDPGGRFRDGSALSKALEKITLNHASSTLRAQVDDDLAGDLLPIDETVAMNRSQSA